jgi:hypothetical protein
MHRSIKIRCVRAVEVTRITGCPLDTMGVFPMLQPGKDFVGQGMSRDQHESG